MSVSQLCHKLSVNLILLGPAQEIIKMAKFLVNLIKVNGRGGGVIVLCEKHLSPYVMGQAKTEDPSDLCVECESEYSLNWECGCNKSDRHSCR